MEEKKKREAVYDPEAQKRWEQKNKDKRGRINRKSGAKRFIREDATMDELQELKALIADREKQFETE